MKNSVPLKTYPLDRECGTEESYLNKSDDEKTSQELLQELKATRQQLKKEREFINTVYKHSEISVFVVTVNGNGEYIYEGINPAHERLLGLDRSELIGYAPSVLAKYFDENVVTYVTRLYDECVKKRATISSEFYVPNGPAKGWWLSTLTPLFDQNGCVYKLLGNGTLITEQKELEERLKNANENLEDMVRSRTKDLLAAKKLAEEANQAKSVFLASMGHELRTPLNNIMGFSELLYRYADSDTETKFLDVIHSSGQHLLKLINNVLDISKLESGEISLSRDNVHIATLLNDILNLFCLKVKEKGVVLSYDIDEILPECICIDELKLRQVIINLIANAVKFTNQGSINIAVDKVSSSNKHFFIEIKVSDTGVGISQSDLTHIFKAFSQSEAGKLSKDGTGLGLFISEKIVRAMGGEIKVESKIGIGSVFTVLFPVEEIENPVPLNDSPVRKIPTGLVSGQPDYRILIVDDNYSSRKLLKTTLNILPIHICEAGRGEQAIDLCRSFNPHLIFMDLRMPGMDGLEATKKIREFNSSVVIIAVSASCFEQEHVKAVNVGCNVLLRKPFMLGDIFSALEEHLKVEFIYS